MSTYAYDARYALAKAESTYGTDAVPAAGDIVRFGEVTVDVKDSVTELEGPSPFRAGWKPVLTDTSAAYTGKCWISPVTITDANDVPEIDAILRAGGLLPVYDAGPPLTRTYSLSSFSGLHDSMTLEEHLVNTTNTAYLKRHVDGCRHDWSIAIPSEGLWEYSILNGMGISGAETIVASAGLTTDVSSAKPAVGAETVITVTPLGGTAHPGVVVSADVRGLMEPTPRRGLGGSLGPLSIELMGRKPFELDVTMDLLRDGTWDSKALMRAGTLVTVVMTIDPGAGDTISMPLIGTIHAVEPIADSQKFIAEKLTIKGTYPDYSSDGGGLRGADGNLQLIFATTP